MSMSQAHDSGRLLHWLKGAKRVRESATHRGAPAQLRARSSGTSPHGIADQPPGRAARIAPGVRLFERSADLRHVSLGLMSRLGRNGRDYVQANYRWDVILGKYEKMFTRLRSAGSSPRRAHSG